MDLREIARIHERGEMGIVERLVALELLDNRVASLAALANETGPAKTSEPAPLAHLERVPFGRPVTAVPVTQGSLFDVSPVRTGYE